MQGVLATVVRYHGRIPLGAGGLVRACTHPVAQVPLGSEKTPVTPQLIERCAPPYALEGCLRRWGAVQARCWR